ncbi:hypothetical protein LJC53_02060 [Bacteroidales bacterium OttesenSCG-928-C03]|nr:hypothetical protein [Bacteroidales bacterium OttesenSCG-928-C03]
MASKNIYKVKVRVHPAVHRHLENNFQKKQGAFDLRKHFYYKLVSAGLSRGKVAVPSMLSKRYGKLKEVEILVTSWDYHHFGDQIAPVYQVSLSKYLYEELLYNACQYVLLVHVLGLIPRDTAIKEYLLNNLFEQDELNYPALRKHYQRHWMETERTLKEDIANMSIKPSGK